jgi:hypothetical protein
MKNHAILFLFAILTIVLASCSNTEEPANTELMTIEKIEATPGYSWFKPRYDDFKPDSLMLLKIKAAYNINTDIFILYAKPSCSCEDAMKIFPNIVKTLDSAGVPPSNILIYSMQNANSPQPWQSKLKVNSIPAAYLLRDSMPVYSIIDTINYLKKNDPNDLTSIETLILKALSVSH